MIDGIRKRCILAAPRTPTLIVVIIGAFAFIFRRWTTRKAFQMTLQSPPSNSFADFTVLGHLVLGSAWNLAYWWARSRARSRTRGGENKFVYLLHFFNSFRLQFLFNQAAHVILELLLPLARLVRRVWFECHGGDNKASLDGNGSLGLEPSVILDEQYASGMA